MSGVPASRAWSFPIRSMERIGMELEYMIVDRETLDIRPLADLLLREAAGGEAWVSDHDPPGAEGIGWSNELVNHVIELKTVEPVSSLGGLAAAFQRQVADIDRRLAAHGARLLGGAMHPWMDPARETHLWAHEYNPVYERYDAIFSCRGHGWSNLQSAHLNLPFGDDAEFGRLHAAIRLVLPLLPGLAAASPVMDGRRTGAADNRLLVYRDNCARLPSVTGRVIPEPIANREAYERDILDVIARDVAPHDPEGVLQPEWVNARGAIARFDRGSIEIRVLDVQESPRMDLAVAELARRAIDALLAERWVALEEVAAVPTDALVALLEETVVSAERTPVRDGPVGRALGAPPGASAGELWAGLAGALLPDDSEFAADLALIADRGTLSTRLTRRLEAGAGLRDVYGELADALAAGAALT